MGRGEYKCLSEVPHHHSLLSLAQLHQALSRNAVLMASVWVSSSRRCDQQ